MATPDPSRVVSPASLRNARLSFSQDLARDIENLSATLNDLHRKVSGVTTTVTRIATAPATTPVVPVPPAPTPTPASTPAQPIPSGSIDGTNKVFTLPDTPDANTLTLWLNGVEQDAAIDYLLSGNTITYTIAPEVGDRHLAAYTHS